MLQIIGLTKVYDSGNEKVTALNGINVTFPDKGLMVILGKSGCGKTTLINMIGGLDKPTRGKVIVNGKNIVSLNGGSFDSYRNTYIGVVFQEFNLIDDISVYDNIEMSLKLADKNADVNTVDEVLSMVGLSNLGYRKPNELSGGQKQRVALARTLIKKPEIILADEPTGALDAGTSEEVFESLKKIAETKLVIIVTHNRDLAFTYGERVLEMTDGQFVSDRQRAVSASDSTKALNTHLLELSATSKLDKNSLNRMLDNQEWGKEVYLGLSYDKDRIALAYSDVVDSFYEKTETSAYHPTASVPVTTDRTFALSKGRLRLKDAARLARKNIKRTKKRYRLLTVLTTVSMVCVMISIILGSVSIFQMVSNSTFDRSGQMFVEVQRGYNNALTTTDMDTVRTYFGENTVIAGENSTYASPLYADKASGDNYFYSGTSQYTFTNFTGVIEGITPDELGYEMVQGSTKPTTIHEIVISDFAAYELCRSGFVGKNPAGVTGIYHPKTESEVLGYSVRLSSITTPFKIVGIFRTNHADYAALLSSNDRNSDLAGEFSANNNFAYAKIFGVVGLSSVLPSNDGNSNNYYTEISVGSNNVYNSSSSTLDFAYDDDVSFSGFVGSNKYYTTTGTVADKPAALGDNQIMLSAGTLLSVIQRYAVANNSGSVDFAAIMNQYYSSGDLTALWSNATYRAFLNQPLKVDISYGNWSLRVPQMSQQDITLVGIYENGYKEHSSHSLLLSPNIVELAAGGNTKVMTYSRLIVSRGSSAIALENSLRSLYESSPSDIYSTMWSFGSAKAPSYNIMSLNSMLSVLQPVFFYISLAFMVMAFLIILNFMSQSVRFRLKEIAVLRLVGAKQSDIARIFLTEAGFITLRVGIIASILTFIVTMVLNSVLRGVMSFFSLSITILAFNPLHVVGIFLITALFTVIASLIPILGVTMKKPIEAIKLGGTN